MKKMIFLSFLLATTLCGYPHSWDRVREDTVSSELPFIPGWCSKDLADRLMQFIYENKPLVCVEIGSFAGSTSYPIVQTLRFLEQGVLYAVDAWDQEAVKEGFEPDHPHLKWWSQMNIDMRSIQHYFESLFFKDHLRKYCYPIKMRSQEAASLFLDEQIDFLFMDGNCSAEGSLQDATLYFPKVKKGGYIWLNQADLPTKNKATTFLMQRCEWIKEKSMGIHCLVFKKI